jgi:acyl dehydratase
VPASGWGKITEEEIQRIDGRINQWRLSKPVWRDATRDAFRSVARAIGNTNPLYQEEEYAAKTRWTGLVAFPLYPISLFRFEGLGTRAPGFPGCQSTHSSGLFRFYRPIKLGDQIAGKGALWEQKLQTSEFAGRMLDQIGRNVTADQTRGEIIAEEYYLGKRWERKSASERRESGKGTYSDWKRWIFTEEELQTIRDDFARIEMRGALPRYWEDVEVGEKLPSLITAPYTGREIIAFFMGYGGPYTLSNKVFYDYLSHHPGLLVPDPLTHTPDVAERTHYDREFARTTGAPDMFDITQPRFCWGATMVTNWMGDDAFLKEISCVARKLNVYGDVTWVNGQVVGKYREGREHLARIALVWDNQRLRHSWGHAVVSLPSREQGAAVLPEPPRDPEGQPYAPLPDDVREALEAKDPEVPFGSRFQRRE